MQRVLAAAVLIAVMSLSSCASRAPYSAEIVASSGPRLVRDDGPLVRVPFTVPGPGHYDVVLWYLITDAGAGYGALGRVAGRAEVTYRGQTVQESTLPRRGRRSERFTDTNGLILLRFRADSAGQYLLRLEVTSVPPYLEISGAGIRVFKLAETRERPNQAMQRTAGRSASSFR
jgi:hypothetical protein